MIQEQRAEPNHSALGDYSLGCSTARERVAVAVLTLKFPLVSVCRQGQNKTFQFGGI